MPKVTLRAHIKVTYYGDPSTIHVDHVEVALTAA